MKREAGSGAALLTRRRLPEWLGDGAEVSELAYRIVVFATAGRRLRRGHHYGIAIECVSIRECVDTLADELDAEEADVLRALAELVRVGALAKGGT